MLLNSLELKILKEFSDDYSKRIYGRAIAKKLNLNQKTVSNMLIRLEKENIIKFSRDGKNKYYFLNKFNPCISEIIKVIEISKKVDFLEHHLKLRTLFEELEKRANGLVIIFGSYAKGTETKNSDLDVFVIRNIKSAENLEHTYKIKINIIKAKAKGLHGSIIFNEVLKSHIILNGLEDFIKLLAYNSI